jgi:hypothetical protein
MKEPLITSKFLELGWHKNVKKFKVRVCVRGCVHWVGQFSVEADGALAYDKAVPALNLDAILNTNFATFDEYEKARQTEMESRSDINDLISLEEVGRQIDQINVDKFSYAFTRVVSQLRNADAAVESSSHVLCAKDDEQMNSKLPATSHSLSNKIGLRHVLFSGSKQRSEDNANTHRSKRAKRSSHSYAVQAGTGASNHLLSADIQLAKMSPTKANIAPIEELDKPKSACKGVSSQFESKLQSRRKFKGKQYHLGSYALEADSATVR